MLSAEHQRVRRWPTIQTTVSQTSRGTSRGTPARRRAGNRVTVFRALTMSVAFYVILKDA